MDKENTLTHIFYGTFMKYYSIEKTKFLYLYFHTYKNLSFHDLLNMWRAQNRVSNGLFTALQPFLWHYPLP